MKHHQIAHEITKTFVAYLNIFGIGHDDIQFWTQPHSNKFSVLLYQAHDKIKIFCLFLNSKSNYRNEFIFHLKFNWMASFVDI